MPGRPITSFINSPLYNVSKFVSEPISKVIGKTESYVRDSWHLAEFINDFNIPDNHVFVSLDVKAMYTNIPSSMVIESITNRWQKIKLFTKLDFDDFISLVKFCLNNSYII